MNRLYAVESCLSLTGAAADHRLPVRSNQIASCVAILEWEIRARLQNSQAAEAKQPQPPEEVREIPELPFLVALAEDLVSNSGQSVVTAGPSQPSEVHAAVARINAALGNVGVTVFYLPDPEPQRPSHVEAIRALADDMRGQRADARRAWRESGL